MAADNQDIIAICQTNGATSTQYNTALMEMAVAQGATLQQVQEQINQVLGAAGYTGTPQERWKKWVDETGGVFAPAYTYQWTIGNSGTNYGFLAATYGNLTPTTAPHADPDPITEIRVDNLNYMYVKVLGSQTGTTVYAVIEGYNTDATPITLSGDVGQWFGLSTGLHTYISGQLGNTLGLNLYDTDPSV